MMTASRRDYVAIAGTFAAELRRIYGETAPLSAERDGALDTHHSLIMRQAEVLAATNPNFDRAQFVAACQEA